MLPVSPAPIPASTRRANSRGLTGVPFPCPLMPASRREGRTAGAVTTATSDARGAAGGMVESTAWPRRTTTAASRRPTPTSARLLVGWLEFHRATLARKCAGLTEAQLRPAPSRRPSLSLVGLVRHLTEIERLYIRHGFAGEPMSALLVRQRQRARRRLRPAGRRPRVAGRVAGARGGRPGARRGGARPRCPRRAVAGDAALGAAKVGQEYARHNGHADLLRQALDGATGE